MTPRTSRSDLLGLRHRSTHPERRSPVRHIVYTGVQLLISFKDQVIDALSQDRGNGRFVCNRSAHFDDNASFGHPKLIILLMPKSRAWVLENKIGTSLGL
jgi:hypothetical protein